MRWRIKANGAQIDLPDDWGQEAQVARVADLETYVKKYQRLPRTITKDYVTSDRAPGPRTPADVLIEGHQLEKMWSSGQLKWDRMAPDEQLALGLATQHVKPEELTADLRFTLGLPLSVPEQISLGMRSHTHPTERSGWMGLGEAGRRAGETFWGTLTAPAEDLPGASFMLKHLTPPPNPADPTWLQALKRTPAETVGSVERAIGAPWSAAAETFAGMTEAPGWIGQRGSRAAFDVGMWAPLAGSAVSAITSRLRPFFARPPAPPSVPAGPPAPAGRAPLALRPGQEPLALPAGPEQRALPGQVGQRALSPPGPEDAEFTVRGETRTAVPDPMAGEGWRRTPGPMISPRRPARAPVAPPYQRALPPPTEGLQFAGPLDPSAPLPDVGVRPPAPPLGPAGQVMGPPPKPTMGLPPMPELPPAPPKAPARKPRASSGPTKYQHVDLGTVNLSDPDEVRSLIEGLGGIRKADIEDIPWWLRGRGTDFDELVKDISKAQRRPPKDVERQLGHTLKRYDQLRVDKRAKDAGKPRPESWETDVPDWVTDEDLWREE